MRKIDYPKIIRSAWKHFKPKIKIRTILDVSVMVSTNHVFRLKLQKGLTVYAKLSFFGQFEHFKEDHQIINALANKLEHPYEKFLAKSLMSEGEVFTCRYSREGLDAWVVFYQAVEINRRPAKKQNLEMVAKLGEELAKFHKVCHQLGSELPGSSKDLDTDIHFLLAYLETDQGKFDFAGHGDVIRSQCSLFLRKLEDLGYREMIRIPVFVDWNIGNFSINDKGAFFSRWDYDWFRVSSRTLDFYFFSRVVSSAGDQTVFSFTPYTLSEDKFILFLRSYHRVFPLTRQEILFIKEAYRFFILNYIIKEGNYFYHQYYAPRLQKEAFDLYFPILDRNFEVDRILEEIDV